MIRRVHVRDPRSTPVRWMPSVPWLQQGPIDLGPGLTFIFGPNGAGKSTFILALSRLFHCAQGGRQVVTIESVRAVVDDATDALLGGVDVLHDAAPVSCFDASKIVGFAGSQFDDDFFDEGLENFFRGRSSSGESMHGRLRAMLRQTRVPVEDRTTESYNDIWRKRVASAKAFLAPTMPEAERTGRPTILLDEPDRSMDIPRRTKLWSVLREAAAEAQVVVATHDPLVLFMPEGAATFIEPVPGYVERCREAVEAASDGRAAT